MIAYSSVGMLSNTTFPFMACNLGTSWCLTHTKIEIVPLIISHFLFSISHSLYSKKKDPRVHCKSYFAILLPGKFLRYLGNKPKRTVYTTCIHRYRKQLQ
jgi:hypothetical protein